MRLTRNWTRAVAALSFTATLALSATAMAQVKLRWSEGQPNRGVQANNLQWMAEEIGKRTNGEVTAEIHWGGALLDSRSGLKGVGSRAADIAAIISAYTPKELAAYGVGDVPIPNADIWVGMRAIYELSLTHPALQKMFDDLNLVYLTNLSTSAIQVLCKNKFLTTLDDIKGVKIRAAGSYGDVLGDLGAEVVRMSQGKVYTALDSGVVECNQNYLYAIEVFKQNEVAKKLTKLDWGQHLSYGIVMNKDAFNELSKEQQEIIREISSEFIDRFAQQLSEANEEALKRMTSDEKPVEVAVMNPEDKKKLEEMGYAKVPGWIERMTAEGLPAQDIYDTYTALIAKYEKIRDEQGYPWNRK